MTVKAEQTPLIASLPSALPACIAANVRPALGKIKAHQFSVKVMRRAPAITATVLMKKNQKAKRMTKSPERMPTTLTSSPSAMLGVVNWFGGMTLGACFAREISPAAV
jgi:hypothetical protein